MALSDHVVLTISQDSVGVARAGFGVPLVLSYGASFSERVQFVTSLSDMVTLGFATTSPEYLAVQALLSQSPHPSSIAIGRGALPATQKYEFTPTAKNSHAYVINVKGEGVTATAVSFTSDATATVAEICTGLTSALNAVTGKNFTCVDGTTKITVTGDAAGDWFSLELADTTDGKLEQTHADPGVATDLAAIVLENDSWYCLLTTYNSDAYVKAAAAWVETQKKIYVVDICDNEAITLADGGGDLADDLNALGYERTSLWFHPSPAIMLAPAMAGRALPYDPGSITWKFKTLSGVTPVSLTATHRTNLVAKKCNTYQTVAGVNITWEGYRCDGDFIDVTRGLDWLDNDMSTRVFGVLASAPKIPYTDEGGAVLQSAVEASLLYGVQKGVLKSDPAPSVEVPKVADIADADKTARNFPDIKWSAELAGAVHKATINGSVTV